MRNVFLNKLKKHAGFTLIELLVVIAIISLLSSIVLSSLQTAKIKSRDTRRLSDMRQIQIALQIYFTTLGAYPGNTDPDGPCGGWDVSKNGIFISPLVSNNFLTSNISDLKDAPANPGCGNYAYFRYNAGSYTCNSNRGAFYVLGVRNMETSGNPYPSSPGWSCPTRNWQTEFEWVTGQFEN